MKQNFAILFKENQRGPRVLNILSATMEYMELRLTVMLLDFRERGFARLIVIRCAKAVDYSIRPPNPNTIEGGPEIEYHEKHKLLEDPRLQMIPGGDGEVFNPPLKLSLLICDQSHFIAEKFELEEPEREKSINAR